MTATVSTPRVRQGALLREVAVGRRNETPSHGPQPRRAFMRLHDRRTCDGATL